jgi:hypothetical protein
LPPALTELDLQIFEQPVAARKGSKSLITQFLRHKLQKALTEHNVSAHTFAEEAARMRHKEDMSGRWNQGRRPYIGNRYNLKTLAGSNFGSPRDATRVG